MKMEKQKKSEKLFGIPREQLKFVTGGGGVIIMEPRDTLVYADRAVIPTSK